MLAASPCPVCGQYVRPEPTERTEAYRLFRCGACLSEFADPMTPAPPEWYASREHYGDRWEFSVSLADLSNAAHSLLEIGSGEGIYVQMARERGIDAIGLDLNAAAVAIARAKGLPVISSTVASYLDQNPRCFDAAALFHTLEHLPDPHGFLLSLRDVLVPEGLLALSVPNPNRWYIAQGKREWFDFPPHHLLRFSVSGLCRLLERSGFKVLKLVEEPLSPWRTTHQELWLRAMQAVRFGATRRVAERAALRAGPASMLTPAHDRPPLPSWMSIAVKAKGAILSAAVTPLSLLRAARFRAQFSGRGGLSLYALARKC